ncbi:LysR family transcriptional regulator [Bradyrhizobium sp. INPA01-394B]|uniref:LysR family transcriptional regulator n=1 Tax=Bradyrhizobium campsiandrae TaxID=1729892 RepID=A0ABR7U3K8_9BRAD|nr:LysR family transcriptional regulator [Bradyrhizobium campsiandrae]MBC9879911.1 LysR family transcriptional regulator [Bradyrhizobium campsiandrae]MBC9978596.1 LysR family transcriptional regulator [Bradyrhizobium campsiandrae]
MDLKHLRCFVTVAEELHYGKAAARLHMAPSALSRHIRMLEEELDVRLFSRTTRSVVLTRAGTVFLDEAKDILQRTKSAQRSVQEAARDEGEILRIGALDSAAAGFLPEVLYAFRQEQGRVKIQLEEATTSRQLQGLMTGRLDIGFLRPPVKEPDLQWEYLTRERLLVALPQSHDLHEREEVGLHEILNEPLILPPKRTRPCTFGLIMRFFDAVGAHPNIVQEATEKQTIVAMVAAGMGVALVPEWVAMLRVRGVVYKPLAFVLADPPPPEAILGVCWRKHQRLASRDLFLDAVRAHFQRGDVAPIAPHNVTPFDRERTRTA